MQDKYMNEIREIIAEVLELDPDEIRDTSHFTEDHGADSLRVIEILARLEKTYQTDIPQKELDNMTNLTAVYHVVKTYTQWPD